MISRLIGGAFRRAAVLPLRALSPDARAAAVEQLSATSIAESRVGGVLVRFFAPSTLLRYRAATLQSKEPDMLAWLDGLDADDVLWDVGANVGVFSLYAALARRCRVLAFEPAAANYFVLTRNLQLNAATDRVTAYCLALAGRSGLGAINLDSPELGAALSHFGAAGESSRYAGRAATLSHGMIGVTVDEFIARFNAPAPTHLKIDVDGLEWPILQGAATTLADPRLRSAMIELSLSRPDERQAAIDFLAARGFMLRSQGAAQGAAAEQAANHLFARA